MKINEVSERGRKYISQNVKRIGAGGDEVTSRIVTNNKAEN